MLRRFVCGSGIRFFVWISYNRYCEDGLSAFYLNPPKNLFMANFLPLSTTRLNQNGGKYLII